MSAAGNEFEPFQIILKSQSADIADVDLDVTDLRNSGNHVLSKSNITTYFERYLDLNKPSSIDGGDGEWPDPLIPRIDRYAKERRNAFPFRLLRGRNQPLWIEVYIPPNTPAGIYKGQVKVLVASQGEAEHRASHRISALIGWAQEGKRRSAAWAAWAGMTRRAA